MSGSTVTNVKSRRVPATTEAKRPKRYACTFPGCTKRYSRPCLTEQHMRSHFDERNFVCSFPRCGKSFLRNSHLTVHMLIHKKEKPHVCPHCGKGFNTGQQISRHLVAHRNNSIRTYEDGGGRKVTGTKTQAVEFEEVAKSSNDSLFNLAYTVYRDFSTEKSIGGDSGGDGEVDHGSKSSLISVDSSTYNSGPLLGTPSSGTFENADPAASKISFSDSQSIADLVWEINSKSSVATSNISTPTPEASDATRLNDCNDISADFDLLLQNGQVWWCKDDACHGIIGYGSIGEIISHYYTTHHYVPEDLHILYEDLVSRPPENDLDPNVDPIYFYLPGTGCPVNVHLMEDTNTSIW